MCISIYIYFINFILATDFDLHNVCIFYIQYMCSKCDVHLGYFFLLDFIIFMQDEKESVETGCPG